MDDLEMLLYTSMNDEVDSETSAPMSAYIAGERSGPTTSEIGEIFNSLISSEVISRSPRNWPGMNIVDVSANNGKVALELAKLFDSSMELTRHKDLEDGHSTKWADKKVTMHINDLSYSDILDRETKLVGVATKNFDQISGLKHVKSGKLLNKDAKDLTQDDIDGLADIVIDRLGALFYAAIDSRESVDSLLGTYSNLLKDGGVAVIDDYGNFKSNQDAHNSTGSYLRGMFTSNTEFKEHMNKLGFEAVNTDSGLHRIKVENRGNIVDDRAKLIILKKTTPTKDRAHNK